MRGRTKGELDHSQSRKGPGRSATRAANLKGNKRQSCKWNASPARGPLWQSSLRWQPGSPSGIANQLALSYGGYQEAHHMAERMFEILPVTAVQRMPACPFKPFSSPNIQ